MREACSKMFILSKGVDFMLYFCYFLLLMFTINQTLNIHKSKNRLNFLNKFSQFFISEAEIVYFQT